MDTRFNAPPANATRAILALVAIFAVFAAWTLATYDSPAYCKDRGTNLTTCIHGERPD